jgi:hypothetical protein
MPEDKYKPPYAFSTTIGTACDVKSCTFIDLAEKLKMPVEDLMRQANGHASPPKALVKGRARELDIAESYRKASGSELDFWGKVPFECPQTFWIFLCKFVGLNERAGVKLPLGLLTSPSSPVHPCRRRSRA